LETAVVSITSIHGGTAFNVIPPEVNMLGTVRTYLPEVREMVLKRMEEIITGIAESMGCEAAVQINHVTPPVNNDIKLSKRIRGLVTQLLPNDILTIDERTMGSEDMAFMMEDIPGCYILIGSKNKEKDLVYGHHHPKFDIDEEAMPRGVALLTAAVFYLLNSN
jgi:amidohydrolase